MSLSISPQQIYEDFLWSQMLGAFALDANSGSGVINTDVDNHDLTQCLIA
jgi:hypothetical protein